jgi:hypothetical protein
LAYLYLVGPSFKRDGEKTKRRADILAIFDREIPTSSSPRAKFDHLIGHNAQLRRGLSKLRDGA